MSDKNKKSSLEEAKLNFEEIQKFAQEQAASSLEEQVAEKLKQLFEETLNEDTTINIDSSGNIEISSTGEVVSSDDSENSNYESKEDMELNIDDQTTFGDSEDKEEFIVSDELDEISLEEIMDETIQNENMEEMNNMKMEDAAAIPTPDVTAAPAPDATAAPAPDATAAPAPDAATGVTPVEEAPTMPELLSKLDTLINIMMQQQGGEESVTPAGAEAGTEQEFDVIDDEAGVVPGTAPEGAPAPMAPTMEEEIEIIDFEDDTEFIDEMEEQMLEIVDEDIYEEGPSVDETRSLGFTSKRTGDKQLKMDTMEKNKGHHAPVTSLKTIKENKAQDESKLDELIKENKGLKNTVKSLQGERKEFEEAFVDLRTQFNEMQLFNGKLALVNKVLMNGGLTTEEKIKVCEQFDGVQTYEEASKLFKNIIKENNIKIGDATNKLKGNATNTGKPKSKTETLYESDEARRLKKLAGINKQEEEN